MHECPACGRMCDCDGEDLFGRAPDDCDCDCYLDDEGLDEGLEDEPLDELETATGTCRACGCTDDEPCEMLTPAGLIAGMCHWVDAAHTRCSRCFTEDGRGRE